MSLKVGDRLGHYNVTALIGEGGMGQVYRATDTQLGRDVALKVLPDAFAADTDRLARFQREARVLASLNHPGIAAIYGIEEDEAGGTRALVLELVEGPTLADRIAQGAMSVDDALPLAGQIAVALEAAHEAGVIHRDLKPANIKVREDGTVKVLDFGLAKALDTTPVGDPSQSPTLTAAATQMGVIMGTAAYMSPEQARGKPVDKRADIWAFGCVLYEMLAGERAFQGEDVSLTLASVMKSELDAKTLPRDVPPTLRTVLRRCLEKDSKDRLRDMGDVRLAMTGAFEPPAPVDAVAVGPASAGWRRLWPVLVGVVVGVVGASLALWSLTRADGSVSRPTRRFAIGPPPEAALALQPGVIIALSPDGRTMVYSGRGADPGSTRLYRRPMDQLDLVPVRDTEDAVGPFFSPDGEWVAFWEGAAGPLRKVSLAGGSASTVAGTPGGSGSWGPDDTIVFGQRGAGLAQVSANSGDPTPLTTPEAGETHQTPHFLPGGRALLFSVVGTSNVDGQVAVYSVETGEWRTLLAGRAPRYSQGHVVAARGDSLWAASFDLDTLELTGDPFLVLEGAAVGAPGTTQFDVSRDGTLIYAPEGMLGGRPDNTIVSVDLQGASTPLLEEPRSYVAPRFSPDGRRLFVQLFGDDGNQVWVHDVERGTLSPFATEPPYNGFPVPAPDGEHVAFSGGAERNLYSRRVDGSGETTVLLEKAGRQYPESWSPNGDVLAFLERHPETGSDIWMLSADGTAEPFMVTDAAEPAARFSNDGRWVAYQTDESGRSEVWLTPYPGPGPTHQVSTNGGTSPQWSPDGCELFYVTEEGELMSVVVDTEPEVALGAPRLIFEDLDLTGPLTDQFAVHPDGDRFAVVLRLDAAAGRTQINVILNWTAELVSPFSN